MSTKLKINDQVIVVTGQNKGQVGKILSIISKKDKQGNKGDAALATVSGVNLRQKAVKPRPEAGIEGGFQSINAPINLSNLAIYNPETGKKDKVRYTELEGKKVRVFASNNEHIDK